MIRTFLVPYYRLLSPDSIYFWTDAGFSNMAERRRRKDRSNLFWNKFRKRCFAAPSPRPLSLRSCSRNRTDDFWTVAKILRVRYVRKNICSFFYATWVDVESNSCDTNCQIWLTAVSLHGRCVEDSKKKWL